MRSRTAGWRNAEAAFTSPILDLIELSGYAKLFSELHHEPLLWQTCTQRWDKYLQPPHQREQLEWLGAVISYNRSLFAITPRSIIRTSWKMRFDLALRNLPRTYSSKRSKLPQRSIVDDQFVDHPSLLIKVIGGNNPNYPSFYDGADVFVELFLAEFPEAKGIRFGIRNRLQDSIERFKKYQTESGSNTFDYDE